MEFALRAYQTDLASSRAGDLTGKRWARSVSSPASAGPGLPRRVAQFSGSQEFSRRAANAFTPHQFTRHPDTEALALRFRCLVELERLQFGENRSHENLRLDAKHEPIGIIG